MAEEVFTGAAGSEVSMEAEVEDTADFMEVEDMEVFMAGTEAWEARDSMVIRAVTTEDTREATTVVTLAAEAIVAGIAADTERADTAVGCPMVTPTLEIAIRRPIVVSSIIF